jgi:hypothetical protein
MDNPVDTSEIPTLKKKRSIKFTKVKQKKIPFQQANSSNLQSKSRIRKFASKLLDPTPKRSRPSQNKENQTKNSLESYMSTSLKRKIRRQMTFKPKVSSFVSNHPYFRGCSIGDSTQKIRGSQIKTSSKSMIDQEQSAKSIDFANKLTPRSTHPSPQHSHRTPDNIRLSQKQNLPLFTEKKSKKMPEIGYYCKRVSLFDKSKPLYNETEFCGTEEKTNPFELTKEAENENCLNTEDLVSITKTLKMDNLSPPVLLNKAKEGYSLDVLKIGSPESVKSPNKADDCSYFSPTRVIQVYNSPERVAVIRTPESAKGQKIAPKAPRKIIGEFDSPGSFAFSLSSSSSEERVLMEIKYKEKKSRECWLKDEESQTDLVELVTNSQVLEGLRIIGRLSKMVSFK